MKLFLMYNRDTDGRPHLRSWTEMAPSWLISTTKNRTFPSPKSPQVTWVNSHPSILSPKPLLLGIRWKQLVWLLGGGGVWFHSACFCGKHPCCYLSQFSSESSSLLHEYILWCGRQLFLVWDIMNEMLMNIYIQWVWTYNFISLQ